MSTQELQNTLAELIDWDIQDVSAAAEWVENEIEVELMAADFSAFAADKELSSALVEYRFRRDKGIKSEFAWRETAGLMADYLDKAREHMLSFLEGSPKPDEQLTAAEEQLVEMREGIAAVFESYERHFGAGHFSASYRSGVRDLKVSLDAQLEALSAAPKRGRVVWEGNGRVREEAGYHEDERSSYHYTAYYVEPLKITDFDSFLVGTDLDGKCKWLYDGLLVAIKVLEAE